MNSKYVVISPCRNEVEYMEQTLDSMVNQTVTPNKWIIVDDGSTDGTSEILAEYAEKYEWIEIITRKDRGHRAVGPGVIDTLYAGYSSINPDDYD
jgi:glycosyltransferase involved in cell wall biosynthesis